MILGGQVVAVVGLLVLRGIVRYRSRSRVQRGHRHRQGLLGGLLGQAWQMSPMSHKKR